MDKDQDPSDQSKPKPYNTYLKYSGLAVQLVVTIGVVGWLGHLLDNYLNLRFPLFIVIFTIAAFVGVLYQVYRSTNQR
jgi:F0F1-type ATP synthase assembly protein I